MGSLEYSHGWYEAVLLINPRLIRAWTEQTLLKKYLCQNRNSTHQSQFFKEKKGCRVCSVGKQATTCCTAREPRRRFESDPWPCCVFSPVAGK